MRFRKTIIFLVAAVIFPSCRMINTVLHDDTVVARVGSHLLYKSDVLQLIPEGTVGEDSLRIAMQYINTWATDLVFLDIAESKLSKQEKDVTSELEAYRRALLKYRYEQLFVNERLDTSVTAEQVEDYYNEHSSDFILERPLVKAVFMKIDKAVADKKAIKAMLSSVDEGDEWQIEVLSYPQADRYTSYSSKWIDIAVLAEDLGVDHLSITNVKPGTFLENTDASGKYNVAYVSDYAQRGTSAPVEYCTPEINDIILSVRKHRLTSSLERDLLDDARDKGKFVIY